MDVAIRLRVCSALVLLLLVVVLGVVEAVVPGGTTAGPRTASAQNLDRLRVAPEGPRGG